MYVCFYVHVRMFMCVCVSVCINGGYVCLSVTMYNICACVCVRKCPFFSRIPQSLTQYHTLRMAPCLFIFSTKHGV